MGEYDSSSGGVIGSRVAGMLAERGPRQRSAAARSGPAESLAVTRVAADAADAGAMARLAQALGHLQLRQPALSPLACDWPPIAASVLGAAERQRRGRRTMLQRCTTVPATAATSAPMDEGHAAGRADAEHGIRPASGQDALAAHQAGRSGWPGSEQPISSAPGESAGRADRPAGQAGQQRCRAGLCLPAVSLVVHRRRGRDAGDGGNRARGLGTRLARAVERNREETSARSSTTSPGPPGRSGRSADPLGRPARTGPAWPLMRELRETEYQFRGGFVMELHGRSGQASACSRAP